MKKISFRSLYSFQSIVILLICFFTSSTKAQDLLLHKITPEKNIAEQYYNQAILHYENGLTDSAYIYLDKSINEKHIESIFIKGYILYMQKQYEDAFTHFKLYLLKNGSNDYVNHYLSDVNNNITYDTNISLYAFGNLFFDTDNYSIQPQSMIYLYRLWYFLETFPHINVEIIAHSEKGSNEITASYKRARIVYYWLLNQGIDKQRLVYKFNIHDNQLAENDSTEHYINKRVEFKIIKSE
ncbi:MAG: hypothetical protein BWY27_01457 [Bacteroidetes bacterium ADurb.Bin234]|nr:MAG: hypothetical protein BWY27_01457 [Bacteroidetes bacterium ADurb.Bin234]